MISLFRVRRAKKIREKQVRHLRRALRMREYGYSTSEIARAMGLQESTVREMMKESVNN